MGQSLTNWRVWDQPQVAESLTKKYSTSFSGAEVSVYGVTGGDRGETLESKGRIFSSFFLSNWARVRSFSSSLPQQTNNSFTAMKTRSGTFDGGGVKGAAKLSFSTANGKATNIWLTFTRGPNSFYVPLEGEYCVRERLALSRAALLVRSLCYLPSHTFERVTKWSSERTKIS